MGVHFCCGGGIFETRLQDFRDFICFGAFPISVSPLDVSKKLANTNVEDVVTFILIILHAMCKHIHGFDEDLFKITAGKLEHMKRLHKCKLIDIFQCIDCVISMKTMWQTNVVLNKTYFFDRLFIKIEHLLLSPT